MRTMQLPRSTAHAAAASPLSNLQRNMQAQAAWVLYMGVAVLLELASAGSSILSSIKKAAAGQRLSFPVYSSLNVPLCLSDDTDPAEALYAPYISSNSSSKLSAAAVAAAAAWAAAGASAGPQLHVQAPQAAPAAAGSRCAAAAAAAAIEFDPGTPRQCRRRRPSLLWTIAE